VEIRGHGQARPERPRVGVGFLVRGSQHLPTNYRGAGECCTSSPTARSAGSSIGAFQKLLVMLLEGVNARTWHCVSFYVARKFFQHLRGLNPQTPLNAALYICMPTTTSLCHKHVRMDCGVVK